MSIGRGGTGGTLLSGCLPLGVGDLNVLSTMEPELGLRCRGTLPAALPTEAFEALRAIRFVWMAPGSMGEVVCDLSAAAAAAEDSEVLEARLPRKA